MDLWTIRLRRTGALAVEKSGDFPTARPFAHKLHSARANLNKIRESQNQTPATGFSLFRPGSCPNHRSHRNLRSISLAIGEHLAQQDRTITRNLVLAFKPFYGAISHFNPQSRRKHAAGWVAGHHSSRRKKGPISASETRSPSNILARFRSRRFAIPEASASLHCKCCHQGLIRSIKAVRGSGKWI